MRRNLVRPIFTFTALHPSPYVPSRPYSNGGSRHNTWIFPPATSPTLNLRSLFTNTQPPPEWIEPLTDVSELASGTRDLVPSPWVSKILGLLDGSADMEANLNHLCKTFLIKLTPNFVSYVMKSPKLRRNPEIALRFFSWAGRQRKYDHQLECYVSLIEALCLCGQTVDASRLCSSLKGKSFVMTTSAANSLVKSFGGVGMVEELLWVWRQMKENGIEPSLYTFNVLLSGLINSNHVEAAEEIFETMETGKVKPDIVTYNTIMKGYCKAGKIQTAMEKLRAMEEEDWLKVKPDKITYAILIQTYYSKEDFGFCLSLYHEMGEKGLEVPCHVYSLVIGGLCRAGKCVEAHAVFRDMIEKGSETNVATYTALIDSYAKIGRVDEAVKLFEMMRKDGLDLDEITYGVIVTGLCKNGRVDEAIGYFKHCLEKGSVLYSSVIDGLGKAGRIGEARSLFEEMGVKGCPRDSFCYNALIDAVAKSGEIDEAMGLFQRMEDEGVDQTVYTFTILIDGLFRKRRNEDALRLWDEMIEKGVTPTAASFRVLANGLCLSGKVARACKILDELAPMGLVPETAFEDMINVLCKAGRIKEACKLADGIIERGRETSGKLRTVFINALRKSGNSVLAIKLMHSRIGIGYDRMGCFKKRVNFRSLLEK